MIENPDFLRNRNKEKKRFLDYIKSGKKVLRQNGVFGEWHGCDGYVEFPPIMPESGGTFTKIFGCSYLFIGYPEILRVRGIATAKFLFSGIITHVIGRSWIYTFAAGFKYLFFRKRFFYDLDYIAFQIKHRVVHTYDMKESVYNEPVKELKRAFKIAADKVFKIEYETHDIEVVNDKTKTIIEPLHLKKVRERRLNPAGYFLSRTATFIFLFLELDSAYRFRIQDAISHDIFQTLDIISKRNVETIKIFGYIKIGLRVAFMFQPKLKLFFTEFFKEIELEKVKLDEADRYFTLQYISYNFGGKSAEERFAERKKIDKEKNHIFFLGWP